MYDFEAKQWFELPKNDIMKTFGEYQITLNNNFLYFIGGHIEGVVSR